MISNKVMDEILRSTNWLHGQYEKGYINGTIGSICVYKEHLPAEWEDDFHSQDHEAYEFIDEILNIWINNDVTQEEAFNKWIDINF